MPHFKRRKYPFVLAALVVTCWWPVNAGPAVAQSTGPKANPPYKLSVFAKGTDKYSQPDSIEQWRDRIFVGYQNHVAKDGSDHKFSSIVEYSLTGKVLRIFSVPGHNDGLRVVGENNLWALQNEDANPNLVIIDLPSGKQTEYKFAPTVHGGGFDDIVVKDGRILLTASNPTLNGAGMNTAPALVSATLHGNMVDVAPVLEGDAAAIDIPTAAHRTLNLTDPDSLTLDHRGNVVLNSQADAELIFVRNPFSEGRVVGRLPITLAGTATTVDDTAFASDPHSFLLFSDVGADVVYRLENPSFGFEPGTAYSTSDTVGIVATLNLDTGVLSPVATGFVSTRGAIFVDLDRDANREQ
jgi:hypothetical protein